MFCEKWKKRVAELEDELAGVRHDLDVARTTADFWIELVRRRLAGNDRQRMIHLKLAFKEELENERREARTSSVFDYQRGSEA